ncbi:proline-rich transmembrane protein 1-like [Amphiura filiformis]|uniref:proline-rich transmembrane protein 1-like n=1 Tax=Amphiura filiformis TaxID=82378 RepID=UPI003B21786D
MSEKKQNSPPPSYPPPAYNYSTAAYTATTYEPGQVLPNEGAPGQTVIFRQPHAQPPPNDYIVFAIVVTACCCLPFGIVGIVKALDARNKYDIGDYAAAESSSRAARSWSIAGVVCGVFWMMIPIVFWLVWVFAIRPDVFDSLMNAVEDGSIRTTDTYY